MIFILVAKQQVLLTSSGLAGGCLFCEWLHIVRGEEPHLAVELPSPPLPILAQHGEHAALVEAELV